MDVGAALIAHGQAAIAVQPGQRALDDPTVATEVLAGVDPFAGDAHPDVAATQRLTTARDVIGLVGMEFARPPAAPPVGLSDGRDRVDEGLEDHGVVAVGNCQERGAGAAGAVAHNMALRAGYPWVLPRSVGFGPTCSPPFAGMLALSRLTRLQSMRPASPSWSRSVRCKAVPHAGFLPVA